MAAISSSSNFDVPRLGKYDVFISFRGEDTRLNFTSHLYSAFCRENIKAYIDEYSLEKGDRISPALLKAIQESRLSVIIFSKDYASSTWCLEELVHILKCNKERGQIVLPVFYGIDPSCIRKQKETYAAAFAAHEKRFKDKKEKIKEWRDALRAVADIYGFDSRYGSESKLIDKIVQCTLRKLNHMSASVGTDDFKDLVGINKHVEEVENLLSIESSNDVCVIGIWGMGGIGKTTLANVIFSQLIYQFESGCFLENVKEESVKQGLISLQEKLFVKLLEDGQRLDTPFLRSFVKKRLRCKKVLVVIDDVDSAEQVECLIGDHIQFGVGSKVLVTSRDRQVLKNIADVIIYTLEGLDFKDALELFYLNAFKRNCPETGYIELSKRAVSYTKGNPLALKVLGSFLYSKTKEDWENALNKLKMIPNPKILQVFRISYDGLDYDEKNIFLDIACFFKGEKRNFIEKILDGCGFFPTIGITDLLDKSLITINDRGEIWMHDLVQELGWEIVREESIKDPGRRSRLWNIRDVCRIVKNKKETDALEGIYLDMSKIDEEIDLRPTTFQKMCNLRLLKIYNSNNYKNNNEVKVHVRRGLQFFPDSLRYLSWYRYPSKSLPSKFEPLNLVELDMQFSKLKELWNGVQNLGNLKDIDLSFSKELIKLPDLSRAPKLENLNLRRCRSLRGLPNISVNIRSINIEESGIEALPSSFGCLENLVTLDLSLCERLKSLQDLPVNIEVLDFNICKRLQTLPSNIWKLKSLRWLSLSCCSELKLLPEVSEAMEHLTNLNLEGTGIEELPSSIKNLTGLRILNLNDCENLKVFPKSLITLSHFSQLELGYCNIQEIPDSLGSLSSLMVLNLMGNKFKRIPTSIGHLCKLDFLYISHCKNLRHLPELPSSIQIVEASECTSLQTVDTTDVLPSGSTEYIVFIFNNCWEMEQSARDSVLHYFLSRLCYSLSNTTLGEKGYVLRTQTCFPGDQIPDWFSNQWEGSTATLKLPPNWLNNNFLGIATCVALEFEDSVEILDQLNIWTKLSSENDQVYYNSCQDFFVTRHNRNMISSDHVFMWGPDTMCSYLMNLDVVEVSLDFSIESESDQKIQVKRCGIRMIYCQEAEEECPISQEDSMIAEGMSQHLSLSICSYSEEIIPSRHDCSSGSNSEGYCSGCLISELLEEPEVISNQPEPRATDTIHSVAGESYMQRIKCFDICGCLSFLSTIIEGKVRKEN